MKFHTILRIAFLCFRSPLFLAFPDVLAVKTKMLQLFFKMNFQDFQLVVFLDEN